MAASGENNITKLYTGQIGGVHSRGLSRARAAVSLVVLAVSCTEAPTDTPFSDPDSVLVRTVLEYIRAEHPAIDSVAAGYGVPFLANFEVDSSVSDLGTSVGFEICDTGSNCTLLLGRPEADAATGEAEMYYTTRWEVAGMASVTISKLELTLEDGQWTVERRREVSHWESG